MGHCTDCFYITFIDGHMNNKPGSRFKIRSRKCIKYTYNLKYELGIYLTCSNITSYIRRFLLQISSNLHSFHPIMNNPPNIIPWTVL